MNRYTEDDTVIPQHDAEAAGDKSGNGAVDYKAQFLRVTADLQNYQRRVERERQSWMTTAQVSIIESLLPVLDDIDRAVLAVGGSDPDASSRDVIEGFTLVARNMRKVFDTLGVKEILGAGAFDPAYHEALMQVESADHASGDVVAVLVKGYIYKDVVIRHAKVSVAK